MITINVFYIVVAMAAVAAVCGFIGYHFGTQDTKQEIHRNNVAWNLKVIEGVQHMLTTDLSKPHETPPSLTQFNLTWRDAVLYALRIAHRDGQLHQLSKLKGYRHVPGG